MNDTAAHLEERKRTMADNPSRAGIGGPKTEEGKKRSSMNALKHGLTAKSQHAQQLIDEQGGEVFEEILTEMRAVYSPKDRLEELLVRRIAVSLWRLTQTEEMGRNAIQKWGTGWAPPPYYERIMSCERDVDIHLYRAIRTLLRKRQGEKMK